MVSRRHVEYLLFGASLLTVLFLYKSTKILNRISLEVKDDRGYAKSLNIKFEQTSLLDTSGLIRHKEYLRNASVVFKEFGNLKYHRFVYGSSNIKAREEFPGMQNPCPNGIHRGSAVEDILCMKIPPFLPNYKNPCWYKEDRLRCLPYFHIIGVPKSATTDLFNRLIKHPHVVENKGLNNKETWFWSWRKYLQVNRTRYGFMDYKYSQIDGLLKFFGSDLKISKLTNESRLMTFKEYIDTFNIDDIEKYHVDGKHHFITGHGDPMDFTDFHWNYNIPQNIPEAEELQWTTPYLIKHVNPGVKLILLLRDPVERLYSYYFFRKVGNTSIEFHNHVKESLDIWSDCIKSHSQRHCLYDVGIRNKMKVAIYSSFYSSHLKEWLNVFPREQILILRTEDYSKDKRETLQKVFHFLNLSPLSNETIDTISQLPNQFVTEKKLQAGAMMTETRQILVNLYRQSTIELAELLGDDRFAFRDGSFV